jgi:hypothetical protein
MLPAAVELKWLDELDDDDPDTLAEGLHTFSEVARTLAIRGTGNAPVVIRSQSSVTLDLANVNASGKAGGPGGANGGNRGTVAIGAGQAGGGAGGGKPSGGGGGFGTAGANGASANTGGPVAGAANLAALAAPNRGSGGAGGNAGIADGGDGGGGGGTIEITAAGTVTLGTLEARGGNGTNGANGGGGGSGGAILIRGQSVTATTISVAGGTGPGNGGDGGQGRIRIDVPGASAPTTTPAAYRGQTFAANTPLIVRSDRPTLTVFGQPNTQFQYFFEPADGAGVEGPFNVSIGSQGMNTFTPPAPLFRGLNRLCAIVEGGSFNNQRAEALNCIEIVYLFTLQ